ncbi:hypothetical protein Pla22_06400 [Rubripirellula amarantea]|uniref:Cytochrome c domain-containing protein n=1 Tax=Rubripirellula amarantea TaxID=2527999 RepID=A0A5C5WT64_9BACT|nr:hypothetical protein [Rubripirellula amarantea]TWT53012.1 hypothetical protein Pla22_06400 [Rubripirellula amarantea]
MKRLVILLACSIGFATTAMATPEFGKQWKNEFAPKDGNEAFYKEVKKVNCNVCHVKDHPDKKKARNEYGKAVHEFLKKEDFPKDYLKENPEEAKAKILEGFKKANEKESADGKKFGEKIEAHELPATDAGL